MNAGPLDSRLALFALVEVQAVVEDFNEGDCNVFDALDRIRAAIRLADTAGDSRREAA